ncbi:protein kinase domain-containing protein [Actinacidiphila sp. SB3-2]
MIFAPLEADDPSAVSGYRLTARLGAGGMGRVYLAHTPGGRALAVKVIRAEFSQDPEFRRRFGQEVRAAQRVQGLYTAPVVDFDTEGPRPWLATAFVPGPSLADAVSEHGVLPPESVLRLTAGLAEALQFVHGAGIVHRDLKPSNVLLTAEGPRLIDFGIARAADATSVTGTGAMVGTPSFMAPEQAVGADVHAEADIFALGQLAAFAAGGFPAFGEGSSPGVLYRIVHEEPDLTALPPALHPVVSRCLSKDPAHRPPLAQIIEMCGAASPGPAMPSPQHTSWLPERVTRTMARHTPPAPGAGPARIPAPGGTTTYGPAPGAPVHGGPTGAAPSGAGPVSAGPVGAGPTGAGSVGAGPTGAGPVGSGPTGSGPATGEAAGGGRAGRSPAKRAWAYVWEPASRRRHRMTLGIGASVAVWSVVLGMAGHSADQLAAGVSVGGVVFTVAVLAAWVLRRRDRRREGSTPPARRR